MGITLLFSKIKSNRRWCTHHDIVKPKYLISIQVEFILYGIETTFLFILLEFFSEAIGITLIVTILIFMIVPIITFINYRGRCPYCGLILKKK